MKHNTLKKIVSALAILAGIFVVGCSGSSDQNPVVAWQTERTFSKEIIKVYEGKKALKLDDVTYKSEIKQPALAAPVNVLAASLAAIYLPVVNGVDMMAAQNEGRVIYVGVENDVKAGMNRKELIASMTPEQKAAYNGYLAAIKRQDQTKILQTVVIPLLKKIEKEGQKVAALANELKNNPQFRALAGMEALKAGKAIAADASALSAQVADIGSGLALWQKLLEQDKAAREFMKDYPAN